MIHSEFAALFWFGVTCALCYMVGGMSKEVKQADIRRERNYYYLMGLLDAHALYGRFPRRDKRTGKFSK